MKKIVTLLLIVPCLVLGVASASEYPVLENQVETRRAHLQWMLTLQEISMEAVVDYIDEISDGNGMSVLKGLFDEFSEAVDDIESYTTHIGLNNFLRDLKDGTSSFRSETRSKMSEYNGRVLVLLIRIGEKVQESQDQLEALENHYWDSRKANVLKNFDIRVERAQNVLSVLEERGYDISEAQDKLDEIIALRGDLETALDERDNLEILEVSLNALELSRELAEIVRDLQIEVPPSRIVRHWLNVGGRVIERSGVIIEELKNLGLDTDELEDIHGEAESHLAEIEAKLEDGDLEGAIEALQELKDDILELCDTYLDLVFPEGVPDELKDAMGALGERLEEIAEKIAESLQTL